MGQLERRGLLRMPFAKGQVLNTFKTRGSGIAEARHRTNTERGRTHSNSTLPPDILKSGCDSAILWSASARPVWATLHSYLKTHVNVPLYLKRLLRMTHMPKLYDVKS